MKIKNLLKHILAVVCTGFLICGFVTIPIKASAEETTIETPQDSVEEITSDIISAPEQTPADNKNVDLDVFLEWAKQYADEAGVGDEYEKAVESIKTAASTKQVTINTIISIGSIILILGYVIYTKAKNKQLRELLKDTADLLEKQAKGTNALIDGTNENAQSSEEIAKDAKNTKVAVACIARGLYALTDRLAIGNASKESIKTDLNKAVSLTEGNVNENKA